jgi:acyl-CoA thioesterase YciA
MNKNLSISVLATPAHLNNDGDIFGGWLLSQMDLAGIIQCKKYQPAKYVTVAIDKMKFKRHVSIGDLVKIYTKIEKIGNTSITINISANVDRLNGDPEMEVTEGIFTFVKIDDNRTPQKLFRS